MVGLNRSVVLIDLFSCLLREWQFGVSNGGDDFNSHGGFRNRRIKLAVQQFDLGDQPIQCSNFQQRTNALQCQLGHLLDGAKNEGAACGLRNPLLRFVVGLP